MPLLGVGPATSSPEERMTWYQPRGILSAIRRPLIEGLDVKAKSSKTNKSRTGRYPKSVSSRTGAFADRTVSAKESRPPAKSSTSRRGLKTGARSRESRVQAILDKLVKQFEPALRDLAK